MGQRQLRVTQYYPWIYLTSGVERTIMETARRSRHQHTIITNHFDSGATYPEFQELGVKELAPVSVRRALGPVFRSALTIAFQKFDLSQCDVLLIHCDGIGDFSLLRKVKVPVVCFCHSPLRVVFDMDYYQRAKTRYTGGKRVPFEIARWAFRSIDRLLWRRYDHVLFNSNVTRSRASAGGLLRKKSQGQEILHPGFDWHAHTPSDNYEPYFLVPGRIMWTKNIQLSVEAFLHFKRSRQSGRPFKLIVAGRVDQKSAPYLEELQRISKGHDEIEFCLNPTDKELWDLYSNAYTILYPPFNEDWGMVPIEANAFGKPVIATNNGGPTESQVDGETGFLVSPTPESFSAAMQKLANDEDLVRRLGSKARSRSERYDWAGFVNRFDTLVESLVQ